jgi:hypothetical protein
MHVTFHVSCVSKIDVAFKIVIGSNCNFKSYISFGGTQKEHGWHLELRSEDFLHSFARRYAVKYDTVPYSWY